MRRQLFGRHQEHANSWGAQAVGLVLSGFAPNGPLAIEALPPTPNQPFRCGLRLTFGIESPVRPRLGESCRSPRLDQDNVGGQEQGREL